jgi:hypothetical protein
MTDTSFPHSGIMKLGDDLVPIATVPMNVVYFEEAPSFSHMNGIIGVTLLVTANVPDQSNETVKRHASIVAYLKCNIPAARALRNAIDGALLLAQPVEHPEAKAN